MQALLEDLTWRALPIMAMVAEAQVQPDDVPTIIAAVVGSVLTILGSIGTKLLRDFARAMAGGVDALREELKAWRSTIEHRQAELERQVAEQRRMLQELEVRREDLEDEAGSGSRPRTRPRNTPIEARPTRGRGR